MTGVIYARYSSDNQRKKSIEGQLRECKAILRKRMIAKLSVHILTVHYLPEQTTVLIFSEC